MQNQPVQDKPVFIDQMPDYQQALRQIAALPPDKIPGVVKELGLTRDLEERNTKQAAVEAQVADLWQRTRGPAIDAIDAERIATIKTGVAITGAASLGVGAAAGIAAGRRWGGLKGTLTGIVSAVVTGLAGIYASAVTGAASSKKKLDDLLRREQGHFPPELQQLDRQLNDAEQQFAAQIATKMLADQKMLVGQGENMHLVSTKEPQAAESQSMAAKYAIAPASSKADAVKHCGCAHAQR